MTAIYFLIFLLFSTQLAWADIDDEVPIIIREPASDDIQPAEVEARARVSHIVDNKSLKATTTFNDWYIGEILAVESQLPSAGIIGFVEVTGIENKQDGTYDLSVQLLRQSRTNFIQSGDQLIHLDLSTANPRYKGTTDLIVKEQTKNISSKYKPLFTQGLTSGETAQTLWQNEYLITIFGQIHYGVTPWLTMNTLVPANFLGALNLGAKAEIFDSVANVVSTGLSYAKIPNKTSSVLNLNIYWDSISSDTTISHSLLSIALFTFEQAEESTAIKALGTSSLQAGYEFILGNWDRVLLGPSYNLEAKSVGAYLTYLMIWDKFHLSMSLNATNLKSFKLSAEDGYYPSVEMYWRF